MSPIYDWMEVSKDGLDSLGRLRCVALAGVAAAGLVVGHSLTYSWLSPGPNPLAHTGHGYLDDALFVAGPLALMALVAIALLGAIQNRPRPATRYALPALLGTVQVAGFGLQEVLERMASVVAGPGLWKVLLLGIPIQLVVAAIGSLLVIGLHRAGAALARLIRPVRRLVRAAALPRRSTESRPISNPALAAVRGRAPPVLLPVL